LCLAICNKRIIACGTWPEALSATRRLIFLWITPSHQPPSNRARDFGRELGVDVQGPTSTRCSPDARRQVPRMKPEAAIINNASIIRTQPLPRWLPPQRQKVPIHNFTAGLAHYLPKGIRANCCLARRNPGRRLIPSTMAADAIPKLLASVPMKAFPAKPF